MRRSRNPMPTTGATILLNGSHRRRNAAKARKSTPFSRIVAKLNGVAVSNRRGSRRKNATILLNRRRRNSVAISNRKRHNRGVRKNATILLNRRRRNATILLNGRSRRRNSVAISNRRRRNTGGAFSTAGTLFAPVERLVAKIPVVGKHVAPYVGPIMFGVTGLAVVHYGLKFGFKMLPTDVKAYLAPVAYTAGGVALAIAVVALPMGDKRTKMVLAGSMVAVGAAVDLFRNLSGTVGSLGEDLTGEYDADDMGDDMGDGGLWQLGAEDGLNDPDLSSVQAEYSDAELSDAYYSGADLDEVEGEAALSGPRAWLNRFRSPRRHVRQTSGCSRHAQKHGARWGWVCRLVGFDKFRAIAALPREARVAYIRRLREYALSQIPQATPALLSAQAQSVAASVANAPISSASPVNVAGYGSEYGALLYAGG